MSLIFTYIYICLHVCIHTYLHTHIRSCYDVSICYEGVGGGEGDDGEGSTAKLYLAYCSYINDYQRLCP